MSGDLPLLHRRSLLFHFLIPIVQNWSAKSCTDLFSSTGMELLTDVGTGKTGS